MTSTEETQLLITESNESQLNTTNNKKNDNQNNEISTIKETLAKQKAETNNHNDNFQNDEFLMSNYCLRLNHDVAYNDDNSKASMNDSYNADKSLYEPNNSCSDSKLVYPLKIGLNKIGRAELNHIIILNKNISKNHACIELKENESGELESCFLWDVGSLNKTRLNNHVLKANEKSKIELDDIIEFNMVNFTFSKMDESERNEQQKNRSFFIELNKVGEQENGNVENGSPHKNSLTNGIKKNGGLFEIQNTLDENSSETSTVAKTNGSNLQHLKLHMADTDEEENNEENDVNEKSSRFTNNTSGGTDFHLEMSQSILQPNQSTISTNKSVNESIPDTMVEDSEIIEKKGSSNHESERNQNVKDNEVTTPSENEEKHEVSKITEQKVESIPSDTIIVSQDEKKEVEQVVEKKADESNLVKNDENDEKSSQDKLIIEEIKIDEEKKFENQEKTKETNIVQETVENIAVVQPRKEEPENKQEQLTKEINEQKEVQTLKEPVVEEKIAEKEPIEQESQKNDVALEKKDDILQPPVEEKIETETPKNDEQVDKPVEPVISESNRVAELKPSNITEESIKNDQEKSKTENLTESTKIEDKKEEENSIQTEEQATTTSSSHRGRRSVKPGGQLETFSLQNTEETAKQDEQKVSNARPRRSIRTVLPPPPPPPPSQPKTTKRKSTIAPQPNQDESKSDENKETNDENGEKIEEIVANETNQTRVEELKEAEPVTKVDEIPEEQKAELAPKAQEQPKEQVAAPAASASSTLTRRSSLRIRNTVVTSQTPVAQIKEKLKKTAVNELVDDKVQQVESNENAPEIKVATKRGRKSIISQPVETKAESEETAAKKTRGRRSIVTEASASTDSSKEMKPPAQPVTTSTGRQPRVVRRTTIAILPEQVQEAKQKLATASRSRGKVAAAPMPVIVTAPEEKEEALTTAKKRGGSRRAASSDTNNKKSRKSTNQQQQNLDTYLYDETDNNDDDELNVSSHKRKKNVKSVEKQEENEPKNNESLQKPVKKRATKKNNLNSSLNLNTRKNEEIDDENDALSKTLPFTTKLFFHSKKRKTLPAGTSSGLNNQINIESSSESNDSSAKRYSYLTLSSNKSNNNTKITAQVSATTTSSKKNSIPIEQQSSSKKFKLHQDKSSSENESESEAENEPLSVKKPKQTPSSKTTALTANPDESENTKETAKKGAVKRRPTLKRSEVVESIASNTSTLSRSSRNKKASTSTPKIMATGIILNEKQKQIIANLGGEIVTDPKESTHLITNKIRKSCKFLSCLNKGCFIVNERWLEESNKAKTFANPSAYALTDAQCEKQNKFSLQTSLLKAKSQSLFQDWKFILIHEDSPQEELSRSDVKTIIECGNGEVIDELPNDEQQLTNCCILYTNLAKYKNDTKYAGKVELVKMTLDTFLNSILKQTFDVNHKIDISE